MGFTVVKEQLAATMNIVAPPWVGLSLVLVVCRSTNHALLNTSKHPTDQVANMENYEGGRTVRSRFVASVITDDVAFLIESTRRKSYVPPKFF
jgi:hypothetical protein